MSVVVNEREMETLVGKVFVGLHSEFVFIVIEANTNNFIIIPVDTSRSTLGFRTSLPYSWEFNEEVTASSIMVKYPEAWAKFKADYIEVAERMEQRN